MRRKAIGFYWTLPVPWDGFTDLDPDVDRAASQSRTIAWQREAIRDWARDNGYDLVREAVFMELSPDRGSDLILEPLDRLASEAERIGATILVVDFSRAKQWRTHHTLRDYLESSPGVFLAIWPPDLEAFTAHFDDWRRRQRDWIDAKPERLRKARLAAAPLIATGLSFAAVAHRLNTDGVPSLTGKAWTGDNLRKALNAEKSEPSPLPDIAELQGRHEDHP